MTCVAEGLSMLHKGFRHYIRLCECSLQRVCSTEKQTHTHTRSNE